MENKKTYHVKKILESIISLAYNGIFYDSNRSILFTSSTHPNFEGLILLDYISYTIQPESLFVNSNLRSKRLLNEIGIGSYFASQLFSYNYTYLDTIHEFLSNSTNPYVQKYGTFIGGKLSTSDILKKYPNPIVINKKENITCNIVNNLIYTNVSGIDLTYDLRYFVNPDLNMDYEKSFKLYSYLRDYITDVVPNPENTLIILDYVFKIGNYSRLDDSLNLFACLNKLNTLLS